MFGSWFTFPGLKCWAVDLTSQDSSVGHFFSPSQDSSVGQLNYLPRTQVLGSCSTFPVFKCWAVDLASQDTGVG